MMKFIKKFTIVLTLSILVFSQVAFAAPKLPSTSPYFPIAKELTARKYFEDLDWDNIQLFNRITYSEIFEFLHVYFLGKRIKASGISTYTNRSVVNDRIGQAIDVLFEKKLIPQQAVIHLYKEPRIADIIPIIYGSFDLKTAIRPKTWDFKDVSTNHLDAGIYNYAVTVGAYEPPNAETFGINRPMTRAQFLRLFYVLGTKAKQFPSNNRFERSGGTTTQAPKLEITFTTPKASQSEDEQALEILKSVWGLLKTKYLYRDTVDFKDLTYKAIKQIVEGIDDKYTSFYTPEENQVFVRSLEDNEPFGGIGAKVEQLNNGDITIISPLRGSPSEEAGVMPGDIISHVDGTSLSGMSLNEAIELIKGPEGSKVVLTIKRNGQILKIEVTRGIIKVSTIDWSYVRKGIYYMHINQFTQGSHILFKETIQKMIDHAGGAKYGNEYNINEFGYMQGLVLDLRSNPGGFLEATIQILGEMFEKDTSVVRIRSGENTAYEKTNNTFPLIEKLPIAVLVNKGSASASEIVAGTIQDLNRGRIFGSTTFGKGTVQQLTDFIDGSAIKVTVAEWLTPKGREINKHGITPDEKYEEVLYNDLLNPKDTPFNAAISWLSGLSRRN